MSARLNLSTVVVLLLCASPAPHAQDQDAEVLSAAIAHYSNSKNNPLLVVAAETIEASRILLDHVQHTDSPDWPGALRELRERNAKVQSIGDVRLPANAALVRDALSLIRRVTPSGAEVSDWSPFTHAYPGSQLVQLAAPAYFTPGQKALVYFSAATDGEGQGWVYILEKRGAEWLVVEDKRQQHVHLVLDNLAVLEAHLLLLDPRAPHIANGLVSASEAAVDGVLEALG